MRVELKPKTVSKLKTLIGNFRNVGGGMVQSVINYILGIHCTLDTTNFDKNLDSTIIDCQKLADRVDELVLGEVNVQSDWNQADSGLDDFIKNKPVIPTANTNWLDTTNFDNNLAKTVTTVQILADRVDDFLLQSDWNQTDNTIEDFIKNKPTIPDAQVQADWLQSNIALADYIKNKPDLTETDPVFAAWLESWSYFASWIILDNSMWGSGNLTPDCVNVQVLANEVNALELGGGGSAETTIEENLIGAIDNTNVDFTTTYNYITNTTTLYINGIKQRRGVDYYEIDTNRIAIDEAPQNIGMIDDLRIIYRK